MDLVSQNLLLSSGGKKDSTYVDDVFSTYLYNGSSTTGSGPGQAISNGIKLSNNNAGNSVHLNGTSDYLTIPSSSDFAFGTGDFTWEGWFYLQDDGSYLINFGADVGQLQYYTWGGVTRRLKYYNSSAGTHEDSSTVLSLSTWYHIAAARSSGTTKVFLDGTEKLSFTDNKDYGAEALYLGATNVGGSLLTGNISNVRIVKGQALYTSSFTPSTQALTTTSQGATASNVKLLCCNKNTVTGATVTPGTIAIYGFPLFQGFGPFTATDGEGGLVWLKSRTANNEHALSDTVNGAGKRLMTQSNTAMSTSTESVASFTNSGFTLPSGWNPMVNAANQEYASWTFRKQKGFFDIVTYTGDGTASKTINHSLGSIPGVIIARRTDSWGTWVVYHKDLGNDKILYLNDTVGETTNADQFDKTDPTASSFTVEYTGTGASDLNVNGATYIAYLFAGGQSTAATARSVSFATGNSTYLDIADHSDFTFGTDDFTIECWYKADDLNLSNSWDYIFSSGWPVQLAHTVSGSGSRFTFYMADSNSTSSYIVSDLNTGGGSVHPGQWYHVAVTRSGSTFRIFLDGVLKDTATSSGAAPAPNINSAIGRFTPSSPYYYADGKISNFRYVKGTAVYTEGFIPPTKPLTAITNTKLLCCNSSSVTGSTVTPGTITNNGAIASTNSPFDDLEGFKFGEDGDKNIIKTGSYIGNGSSSGPEINLGWEPQWFIIKNATSGSTNWLLFDSMRGLTASDQTSEANIKPNSSDAEWDNEYLSPTSRGFRLTGTSTWVNQNGNKMIYIAIRRPDGYVGKPPEVGTDVFAMDMGSGVNNVTPYYDSGFPVDLGIYRLISGTSAWWTNIRLVQGQENKTNGTDAQSSWAGSTFDSNTGWADVGSNTYQSWMWKRHAGFDVVTWKGNAVAGRDIEHSLGKIPEMIWLKQRSGTERWIVYQKGLNGGTNPFEYELRLNANNAESRWSNFYDTAPTALSFRVDGGAVTNGNNQEYMALLFASVDGISKVGSYTGTNGSASPGGDIAQTITTGFSPRFVIIKRVDSANNWLVLDTKRGWGAGNDANLFLDENWAQSSFNFGAPTSTGFGLTYDELGYYNSNGGKYIYYAHA